jgi:hypothetical protein
VRRRQFGSFAPGRNAMLVRASAARIFSALTLIPF